jgi:hypothetical protein
MHYSAEIVILPANIVSSPASVDLKLAAGVIRHVSAIFPPGCARMCCIQLYQGSIQVLPTNLGQFYSEDSYTIEADCYIPVDTSANVLTVLGWNTGTFYKHNIHVLVDVKGADEPDEYTAVTALGNGIASLMDLIRSWL